MTHDVELSAFHDALILTSYASRDRTFTVAGRRSVVLGNEASGVNEIRIHPHAVARSVRLGGARTTRFQLSRIGAERTLKLPDCIVSERILVPLDTPGAVLEWSPSHETIVEIQWQAEAAGVVRQDAHSLALKHLSGDDVVFRIDAPDAVWNVKHTGESSVLEVTCRLRVGTSGARLIVASADDAEALSSATRLLSEGAAIVLARKGSLARAQHASLLVRTPDSSVDDAIAWCAHRLRSCAIDVPGIGVSLVSGYAAGIEPTFVTRDAVWAALALLAAGEAALPLDVLRFAVKHQDPNGRIPDSCSLHGKTQFGGSDTTALFLLLVARFTSWTGDFAFAAHEWNAIERATSSVVKESLTPPATPTPTTLLALTEIAQVAEAIGKTHESAELRATLIAQSTNAAPATTQAPAISQRARIALPVSTDSASSRDAQQETIQPVAAPTLLALLAESRACTAFAAGQTGAAFEDWQKRAHSSIATMQDTSMESAVLMLALVHGIIGAEPDAAKHRLVLRPQIPAEWTTFEATHLRVGEADITLRYTRDGSRHHYTLEQRSGSVPVRVIFEPLLPASRIIAAHIDEELADLDSRPFGERVLVPVQIVLDHARTVSIDTVG